MMWHQMRRMVCKKPRARSLTQNRFAHSCLGLAGMGRTDRSSRRRRHSTHLLFVGDAATGKTKLIEVRSLEPRLERQGGVRGLLALSALWLLDFRPRGLLALWLREEESCFIRVLTNVFASALRVALFLAFCITIAMLLFSFYDCQSIVFASRSPLLLFALASDV